LAERPRKSGNRCIPMDRSVLAELGPSKTQNRAANSATPNVGCRTDRGRNRSLASMCGRVAGMPPVHKGPHQQLLRRGSGCNDGSVPRDQPAGRPPYSRPRCLSLHIRPLGICSRFADRGLSVFVIENLPMRSNFWHARPPRELRQRAGAVSSGRSQIRNRPRSRP
jgi:hypothetical protein